MTLKCIILLVFTFSPVFCIAQQSPLEQVENYLNFKDISKEKFLIALNAVSTSKYESARRKLVRKETLDKLTELAKKDLNVAKVLTYLLAISSEEAINNAEIEKSRVLYKLSNNIYSQSHLRRDAVLARVNSHLLFKKLPKKKKAPKVLIFLIILTAGILWIICMMSFFKKKPKLVKEEQDKQQDLMKYFSLNKNSTIEDLNKNYRTMAKSVHPDTAGIEFKDEFQALKDKFEHAKLVLFSS